MTAYTCRGYLKTFQAHSRRILRSLGFPLTSGAGTEQPPRLLHRSRPLVHRQHMEFFLDLCCGASATYERCQCLARMGIHCLQVDLLAAERFGPALSDATYDSLLRLGISQASYATRMPLRLAGTTPA